MIVLFMETHIRHPFVEGGKGNPQVRDRIFSHAFVGEIAIRGSNCGKSFCRARFLGVLGVHWFQVLRIELLSCQVFSWRPRIKTRGQTYVIPRWHCCWSAHSRVIRRVQRLTSVVPSIDTSSVFIFGCSYNLLCSHETIDGSVKESLHSNQDHLFWVLKQLRVFGPSNLC